MDLYRALDRLGIGVKRYEVFPASRLSQRNAAILLQRGKIARVITPPLGIVLPDRAAELRARGIDSFEMLFDLESDPLQDEALAILQPEPICKSCSRRS
jgi:hypothetical protein